MLSKDGAFQLKILKKTLNWPNDTAFIRIALCQLFIILVKIQKNETFEFVGHRPNGLNWFK